MCKSSVLYRICACMFNPLEIYAQVLCSFMICIGFCACMFNSRRICARILTCLNILDERSIADAGGFTGEYKSIEKCFGDDSDLP